jgi:hypothetical protein
MGPGASAAATQSQASVAIDQARTNPDAWNARRDDNLDLRGRS